MLGNKIIKYIWCLSIFFALLKIRAYQDYRYPCEEIKQEFLSKINVGIPDWMTKQIKLDLAYAEKLGITLQMIEQTINQNPTHITKFIIKNGTISFFTFAQDRSKYCQGIVYVLEELNNYIKLPDVIFLFNTDDAPYNYQNLSSNTIPPIGKARYPCPVFVPTKHRNDKNAIMIPDTHSLHIARYLEPIYLANLKFPWEAKESKAFWRGSTTGGIYHPENYYIFPRVKLVHLSQRFPEYLDAKFHKIVQDPSGKIQHLFTQLGYMGNTIQITDHLKYKYQILIDGNSSSWSRSYWQLFTNTVMLKQNSNFIQWYSSLLKPYEHYIPFDYFCFDLIKKIKIAQNNDRKVQEIVKKANLLADQCLKYTDMLLYLYAAIISYSKLQKFKP